MIEVVYKGETQEGTEQVVLPKNVRQVGEIHKDRRVYIEDYVVTYMKQKITENKNLGCVLILTGRREYVQDVLYLFVDGAFQVDYAQVGQDYIFTDKVWENIYENVKKYFISSEIVGWMLYDDDLSEDRLLKAQKKNFPSEDMLLMKQEAYEDESVYYLYRNGILNKLTGFFVYYEKNEAMQEFMVSNYQSNPAAEELRLRQKEAPVASFRSRMREKKEASAQNRTMGALYAASSFLVLLVIIIGITLVNNYDKMKTMENSLNDLAKTAARNELEAAAQKENTEAAGEKEAEEVPAAALVEVVPSGVEPASDSEPLDVEADAQPSDEGSDVQPSDEEPDAQPSDEGFDVQPSDQEAEQPMDQVTSAEALSPVYYTVEPGDTLAGISRKVYGTAGMVEKLCIANGIENGDKILAGQKIILP